MGNIHNVDLSDPTLDAFVKFMQAGREAWKYFDTFLWKKAHSSPVKLIVLQALSRNGGSMSPSQLAEWTQTERHNITALIRRMGEEGLVSQSRDQADKRMVTVSILDKGRDVLTETLPLAMEAVNQIMNSIGVEDAKMLSIYSMALRDNAHHGLAQVSYGLVLIEL